MVCRKAGLAARFACGSGRRPSAPSSRGRRSCAGSAPRACTDCEPFACQPAPESAVSTFGAKAASATATSSQAIETARTWSAVQPPSRPSGPTSTAAPRRSPAGERSWRACSSPASLLDAGPALKHERSGAPTCAHEQPLVETDEDGQQQEPGRDKHGKQHAQERHRAREREEHRSSGQRRCASGAHPFDQLLQRAAAAAAPRRRPARRARTRSRRRSGSRRGCRPCGGRASRRSASTARCLETFCCEAVEGIGELADGRLARRGGGRASGSASARRAPGSGGRRARRGLGNRMRE